MLRILVPLMCVKYLFFRFFQHLFCIYLEGMSELTSLMMSKIVLICKCFFARTHGRYM